MAHQRAVTATRFGEGANAAQMRDQRQHRLERRRVEVAPRRSKLDRLPISRPPVGMGAHCSRLQGGLGGGRLGGVDTWRRHFACGR